MANSEGGTNFDLEALRQAQENKRREIADTKAAEEETANKVIRKKNAEIPAGEMDQLRAETRRLHDQREGLLQNYNPTLAEQLLESQRAAQAELVDTAERLTSLREQRNEIEALVKGEDEQNIAAEVTQAMIEIDTAIKEAETMQKESEKKLTELSDKYAELAQQTRLIDDLSGQITTTETKINELMANPDIYELIYEQTEAEGDVRDRFTENAKRHLSHFRFDSSGKSRGEEGQNFTAEIGNNILDIEIKRLSIDKIQDPTERAKKIAEITRDLMQGVNLSKSIVPHSADREWFKAEQGLKSRDRKETMLKGYVLSQLMDCAQTSAYILPSTLRYDEWRDGGYSGEKVLDQAAKQRIVEELIPVLNKIKAAARVDSMKPYNPGQGESSPATNIYFRNDSYLKDTFQNFHQGTLTTGLEEYGYVDPVDSPIFPRSWIGKPEHTAELKKVQAEFKKEQKRRAKEVNAVRAGREKTRQDRLREIPSEIENTNKQLADISPDKQRQAWNKMEALKEDLEKRKRDKQKTIDAKKEAERLLATKSRQFDGAGALAKRNFLGKGSARVELEKAQHLMGVREKDVSTVDDSIVKLEQQMQKLENDPVYVLVKSGNGSDAVRKLERQAEKLAQDLESYKRESFEIPVSID